MGRHGLVLVGLVMLGLAGCVQAQAPAATVPAAASEAGRVVEAFLAARAARDLDATMANFDEAPELRSSQGINWSGRDAVRAIMAYRLLDTYTVGERQVSGNKVTWREHVRRTIASGAPPANFDEDVEATVVAGRITSLVTYLGGMRAQEPSPALAEPTSPLAPLLVPLSIGLLVLAVIIWPWPDSTEAAPRPRGNQLLSGLQRYAESHAVQSRQKRN